MLKVSPENRHSHADLNNSRAYYLELTNVNNLPDQKSRVRGSLVRLQMKARVDSRDVNIAASFTDQISIIGAR